MAGKDGQRGVIMRAVIVLALLALVIPYQWSKAQTGLRRVRVVIPTAESRKAGTASTLSNHICGTRTHSETKPDHRYQPQGRAGVGIK